VDHRETIHTDPAIAACALLAATVVAVLITPSMGRVAFSTTWANTLRSSTSSKGATCATPAHKAQTVADTSNALRQVVSSLASQALFAPPERWQLEACLFSPVQAHTELAEYVRSPGGRQPLGRDRSVCLPAMNTNLQPERAPPPTSRCIRSSPPRCPYVISTRPARARSLLSLAVLSLALALLEELRWHLLRVLMARGEVRKPKCWRKHNRFRGYKHTHHAHNHPALAGVSTAV